MHALLPGPGVEEGVARLGLKEPHGIDRLSAETAVGEVDHVELTALDLGQRAAFVEVPGQTDRVFVERGGVVEDPADEVPHLVAGQVGLVVEVVTLLGFESVEKVAREGLHQRLVGYLCREGGRCHEGFVLGLVADHVDVQGLDAGIFEVEHVRKFLGVQRWRFFPVRSSRPGLSVPPEPRAEGQMIICVNRRYSFGV